ncbi:MAG: RNA 2',3'-cyclic phosphodiesterase [Bacillus sp. (in: firmicutes)]
MNLLVLKQGAGGIHEDCRGNARKTRPRSETRRLDARQQESEVYAGCGTHRESQKPKKRKGVYMSIQPHYFIAVNLPAELKGIIKEEKERLQSSFSFQKWVHPLDYHLTLAFLGSSSLEQLHTLIHLLTKQIQSEQPFKLQIDKLGIFGNVAKPKIFWLGLKKANHLHTLRNHVFEECKKAGYQLETRSFHPHITLARKWEGSDFREYMKESETLFLERKIEFEVKTIQLFQTHLEKEPKYEAIYTFHF